MIVEARGKDLSLVFQAPKRASVDNPVAITLEVVPIRVGELGVSPALGVFDGKPKVGKRGPAHVRFLIGRGYRRELRWQPGLWARARRAKVREASYLPPGSSLPQPWPERSWPALLIRESSDRRSGHEEVSPPPRHVRSIRRSGPVTVSLGTHRRPFRTPRSVSTAS